MADKIVLLAENEWLKKALKYCQDDKEVMQNEIDILKEQVETLDMCLTSTVEHHEAETNALQRQVKRLLETSIELYKNIESSPDVCNLDEFDEWEKTLGEVADDKS